MRSSSNTNVLIYAIAKDDPRAASADAMLAAGGVVSVQVLNEFVSVARRKLGMTWEEVAEALAAIRTETHETALRIAAKYGYQIDDALIAASALLAGCRRLFSEDLQDGQILEGRLTIINPF